jgi:tRNA threonylcarbamoyladenosine biosynthesis protein TsaE
MHGNLPLKDLAAYGSVILKRITSLSPGETEQVGRSLAQELKPGDTVAFFGGLGMGKTLFIRGLAEGLGIEDAVSSPTFALVHEYRGSTPLYHFDMYRVESYDDLYSTGYFDYLGSAGICAIEWSENVEKALPDDAVRVSIERGPAEDSRIITIKRGVGDEDFSG